MAARLVAAARPTMRRSALRLAGAARQYRVPTRELRFLLHECHDLVSHYERLEHSACDRETLDMVIDESRKLCENELAPMCTNADRQGCKWLGPNDVRTPDGFKEAYELWRESGWQSICFPEEYGGQALPTSLAVVQSDMVASANFTWLMFPGLSKGAINTILAHGSEQLKQTWLPRLVSGEFTGTMCLTEPQCGSDLGQVSTRATPRPDGSYSISGTKIFISCGEHDLTDNIVHCVLARLPGAPEGTRGISLFLVPKRSLDEAGGVGEPNGVVASRIEDKMGCHGSPTCQLEFEEARGWLIGAENKGLNHMFTFINTSRVGTAVQGVAAAELAFQNSLWYAKERRSMRALGGAVEPEAAADPIICHASVRAMLLTQKAYAEGGRSMVVECAKLVDVKMDAEAAGDMPAAARIDERLGFLTPILKGFLTEAAKEAADLGIQMYGGHGFIRDNGAEQIYRDVRIASLWEGTTQIQALDLLGRKIMRQKMRPISEHCAELRGACAPHLLSADASLRSHAWTLLYHTFEWQMLTYRIGARAMGDAEWVSSASVDYLMYGGYVTLAAHWLRMEAAAAAAAAKGGGEEAGFYDAKRQTSAFVFDRLLPRTSAHKAAMLSPLRSVMGMPADDFSFDHARG